MFDSLIDQVLGSLAAVLVSVLVALAVKVLKKVGLSLEADEQAKLEYFAAQGINKAKEMAAVKLKSAVTLSSAEKKAIALDHVLANVPDVTPSVAGAVITATLPQLGEGASGKA